LNLGGGPDGVPLRAEEKVNFNRDVRPVFSDTCFQCHGPDEAKRKAGLRLDTRETAVKPAESGAIAIVPGHPEQSELIKRLTAKDPDDVMPPAKLHKTVTPAQIEAIKKWIAQGAEYQGHWAFLKPERPAVPPVADKSAVVRNPIDNFILARLAKEGLKQSPEADRATLQRRTTSTRDNRTASSARLTAALTSEKRSPRVRSDIDRTRIP